MIPSLFPLCIYRQLHDHRIDVESSSVQKRLLLLNFAFHSNLKHLTKLLKGHSSVLLQILISQMHLESTQWNTQPCSILNTLYDILYLHDYILSHAVKLQLLDDAYYEHNLENVFLRCCQILGCMICAQYSNEDLEVSGVIHGNCFYRID
jgi:hypothetical protein